MANFVVISEVAQENYVLLNFMQVKVFLVRLIQLILSFKILKTIPKIIDIFSQKILVMKKMLIFFINKFIECPINHRKFFYIFNLNRIFYQNLQHELNSVQNNIVRLIVHCICQ